MAGPSAPGADVEHHALRPVVEVAHAVEQVHDDLVLEREACDVFGAGVRLLFLLPWPTGCSYVLLPQP